MSRRIVDFSGPPLRWRVRAGPPAPGAQPRTDLDFGFAGGHATPSGLVLSVGHARPRGVGGAGPGGWGAGRERPEPRAAPHSRSAGGRDPGPRWARAGLEPNGSCAPHRARSSRMVAGGRDPLRCGLDRRSRFADQPSFPGIAGDSSTEPVIAGRASKRCSSSTGPWVTWPIPKTASISPESSDRSSPCATT